MAQPNLFIVGAPKAGTTSLHYYLRQHPEIFMPERKEFHFFGSDLKMILPRISPADYELQFEPGRTAKWRGEASVWYLYSTRAAAELNQYRPDARAIVMLRHPIHLIESLHSQALFIGNEDIANLREAVDAEEDRRNGRRIPATARHVPGLYYRSVVQFAEQIERYYAVFGRERVKVIFLEQMKKDVESVCRDTWKFLDVDPNVVIDWSVKNPNKTVRSVAARNTLLHMRRSSAAGLMRAVVPTPLRLAAGRMFNKFNTVYTERPAIDEEFRASMRPTLEKVTADLRHVLAPEHHKWLDQWQ